ncbi:MULTISPECIES: hypothetical protein [unclassified Rhizobium]|uniref:hypothetical protein n=1 Tax=unclassified Rhizobium TaxID=2613769 RepID=UPI001C83A7A6|nr:MULTISPECIES: hypothetical protein [unclassified Rhizobium]MBX5157814.1 hypothetical protein [Rhizobium sp. NZLR8]MBX5164917.1 hypothetical protein [Rhizobium sp. NZLR4b]MBX5170052.1 hypothetical protein [Rhizobium sp. NZLR1b]MBX5184859.1 hypothetical protein [Rhizobium sp. NZLR5]MBX5193008.1 hypothetical protein [Rhizobium sp. NZLR3b]
MSTHITSNRAASTTPHPMSAIRRASEVRDKIASIEKPEDLRWRLSARAAVIAMMAVMRHRANAMPPQKRCDI